MKLASRPWLSRAAGGLIAAAVLAMIFSAYLRPGFMLDVANRLWLCF